MILRTTVLTVATGLLVIIMAGAMVAFATSNAIGASAIGDTRHSASANQMKPAQCSSLNLTNLIVATGAISGTAENDLILGGSGADTISGEGGNDCILGGGGNDRLYGNSGTDVCIGGSGADILDDSCEARH